MIENDTLLLKNALLNIDYITARKILHELRSGYSSLEIVEKVMTPVLEDIGSGWEEGSISLSQVYMSGCMCEELVDEILPVSDITELTSVPVALATLEDYHLLGSRIVYSIMRAAGIPLHNYGKMTIKSLVEKVREDNIKILLISVLMIPSALHVRELRESLFDEGINVKIVVGGAPFRLDKTLWTEVGADAMGCTASDALKIARRLIRELE